MDLLQVGDIGQWIGVEDQEIRELALGDGAHLRFGREHEGGVARGVDQDLPWCETGLGHQLELAVKSGPMQGADIARVGAGGDDRPAILHRFQVLLHHRHRALEPGAAPGPDLFGIVPHRHLRPGHHDVWIADLTLHIRHSDVAAKNFTVAFHHDQGRGVDRSTLPDQGDELLIDRLVVDAMDENISSGLDGSPCRLELGGVHGDPHSGRMGLVDGRLDDRQIRCEVAVAGDNEPNLDEIGVVFELFAHQLSRHHRRIDLDDRWVADIHLRPRHGRNQRPGNSRPRRIKLFIGLVADSKIPVATTDVHNRRDTACQVATKGLPEVCLDASHFSLVGSPTSEVDHVRPGVESARLKVVDVGIDQAGHDPLSAHIHHREDFRNLDFPAHPDFENAVAHHDHNSILHGVGSGPVEQRGANKSGLSKRVRSPNGKNQNSNNGRRQIAAHGHPLGVEMLPPGPGSRRPWPVLRSG